MSSLHERPPPQKKSMFDSVNVAVYSINLGLGLVEKQCKDSPAGSGILKTELQSTEKGRKKVNCQKWKLLFLAALSEIT